jgi:hypothetical protein
LNFSSFRNQKTLWGDAKMSTMRKSLLPLGLLLGGLVLVVGADARPLAQKPVPQKPAKHPHAEMAVKLLHEIKLLLESADHDYKGHRAAAVREINAAIRDLGGHAKGTGGGGNKEPQTLSDEQLKTAVADLAAIEKKLAGSTHPQAATAAAAVAAAIKELNIALMIR